MSRLDYFLISNNLQESVEKCEILNSVSSDHNPVILTFKNPYTCRKNTAYWKLNTTLLRNNDFIKHEIEALKVQHIGLEPQQKWELLKFKIRSFCIKFSKKIAKQRREELENLENIIKVHETTEIGPNKTYLKA